MKKSFGLLIAIISIVLFGCATTSNISVAPSEIEYKEISGKNYFISRDSELYSSQSNAVYVDYVNQKVKGEVVEAGVTNLFGQIAKTISNIPNIKSFGIRSKLPPAEPVALVRHKWLATNCGKPRSNASHRNF